MTLSFDCREYGMGLTVLCCSFERVSGTCIGGGTYLGLCRLLTKYKDFDAVMELCQKGDPTKCDMLVGYDVGFFMCLNCRLLICSLAPPHTLS
jgi:hypothetical protein